MYLLEGPKLGHLQIQRLMIAKDSNSEELQLWQKLLMNPKAQKLFLSFRCSEISFSFDLK